MYKETEIYAAPCLELADSLFYSHCRGVAQR